MEQETNHTNASSVMFSFLLGGIVGAGLAFLLAPQSGAETRRKLEEASEDLKHKADDFVKSARSSVESAIDKGRGAFEEKRSAISSAIDAGKEAYHREKDKATAEL